MKSPAFRSISPDPRPAPPRGWVRPGVVASLVFAALVPLTTGMWGRPGSIAAPDLELQEPTSANGNAAPPTTQEGVEPAAGLVEEALSEEREAPPATTQFADAESLTAGATTPGDDAKRQLDRSTPAGYYELWTLAPAGVAIILAILMRQVVPALLIGILTAAFMMQPFKEPIGAGAGGGFWYIVDSIRLAVEGYIVGAFAGEKGAEHTMVVLFTLAIGGMVGMIEVSGGTRAVVNAMARFASNARGGQLTAWFSGLLVFFDDYANCMIVGPTMRPVFDRLRLSREKLAYIVDSTAAPVSSIMIGTWLATEISMIDDGLARIPAGGRPDYLAGATGFTIFWASIPYRFYALLAIVMVALVALLRRDFGPMLRAEREAYRNPVLPSTELDAHAGQPGRAWYAIVPVVVIVLGVVGLLFATGYAPGMEKFHEQIAGGEYVPSIGRAAYQQQVEAGTYAPSFRDRVEMVIQILGNCDTYRSLLYAAFAALTLAAFINLTTGAANVKRTFEGMMDGMTRVFPAIVVLGLAWALSAVTTELELGRVAEQFLRYELNFAPRWLPLATFLSAAIVSFATGTSWGTIIILCPIAVQLGAAMTLVMPDGAINEPHDIFYATVGAVLVGAVFGDHCSPISDTTVLSSLASGCSLEAHVWTQMPYALVTAGTSIVVGDILLRQYQQPWWVGLLGGTLVLLFVLLIFGRKAESDGPARARSAQTGS